MFSLLFNCVLIVQLSKEIGFSLKPRPSLTFTKCLDLNLSNFSEQIASIGEVAGKEYAIEQVRRGGGVWP